MKRANDRPEKNEVNNIKTTYQTAVSLSKRKTAILV